MCDLWCREGSTQVKVFKNFKEVAQVRPGFSIEAIYGGALLGIAGADFIAFYEWTTATVRVIYPCRRVPKSGEHRTHNVQSAQTAS
jgi:Coatomer WD associated region